MTALQIDYERCKGVEECGLCIHVCPKEVFQPSETLNQKGYRPPRAAHEDQCSACENCMIFCPDMAIVVSAEKAQRRVKR